MRNGGRYGLFINNPGSLPFKQRYEFCAQCHPGEVDGFAKSVHGQRQLLTCTTCHDVHAPEETRRSYTNHGLCLECHLTRGFADDAAVTAHTFHTVDPEGTVASRCAFCHLPPLDRVHQGPHDHSLTPIAPIRSNEAVAEGVTPTPPNSCAGIIGCHDGTAITAPVFNVDDPKDNAALEPLFDARYGTMNPRR